MKILVISKGISNTSKIVKQMIDNNLQIIVDREVIKMNEELLNKLINRIEMCQRGLLNTCDCTECPLYKDFGDGQNICLKLLEEKKE